MKNIRKGGISLVALVITIIVMIILTGAVIMTFMDDGIIDRAKEAVIRSDYTTLVEAYQIRYLDERIENETNKEIEEIKKIALLKEVVEKLRLEGFTFESNDTVVNYKGDNGYIAAWVLSNFKYKDYRVVRF